MRTKNRTIYCNAHVQGHDFEVSWRTAIEMVICLKIVLLRKIEAYYHSRSILL